jgi:transposase-like protein
MEQGSTTTPARGMEPFSGDAWFDPIEAGIRERVRGFIEELLEQELTQALGRGRHERSAEKPKGYRNGSRERHLLGSFGPVRISVPRARLAAENGGTQEWRSAALPRYARMTRQVEALIAGAYLSGTNTRRVRRALSALFAGAVGKDVVSRTWRKLRADWEAWTRRDLAGEDIVRLILDGTVVRVRLDRKATSISLLVVLGVRRDGQKVLLAVKNIGGESEAAWRGILDDLIARGLRTPEFLITDGAAGLERALAALWPDVPAQRCTVHKHRNLLAHAPDALHDEVTADYTDMIYAGTAQEVQAKRRAFLRKWRLRCPARWPAASRRRAIACSPSSGCPQANGDPCGPQTRSSGCTRSSNAGSRPRPYCHRLRPRPCCSGLCWLPARSPCARSTAGRRSISR